MQLWKYAAVMAGTLALGGCNESPTTGSQQSIEDTRVYILETCPGEASLVRDAIEHSQFATALMDFQALDASFDLILSLVAADLNAGRLPKERAEEVERIRQWRFKFLFTVASPATAPNSRASEKQREAANNLINADIAFRRAEAELKRATDDGASADLQAQFGRQRDAADALRSERWNEFYLSLKERDNQNFLALPAGLGVAVASAVIPALVDVSLDLIASAVREAAKDSAKSAAAIAVTHLHGFPRDDGDTPAPALTVNPGFGCLVIVRGKFAAPTETDTGNHAVFRRSIGISSDRDLYFYLSLKIAFSNDYSAFRLTPTSARINSYIEDKRRGAAPEIVLNVSLASARAARDAAPIAISTLSLPRVQLNTELDAQALAGTASGWTAFPGGDAVAKDALQALEKAFAAVRESAQARQRVAAFEACTEVLKKLTDETTTLDLIQKFGPQTPFEPSVCWPYIAVVQRAALDTVVARTPATRNSVTDQNAPVLAARVALAELHDNARRDRALMSIEARRLRAYEEALGAARLFTPVTLEVEIIENRKGSPFWKAVADVLDKSKKGVGEALVASLSPAERAKRRADEEQQVRTNRAAVATAEDNVRLRQAELDDLPSTASRAERVRAENALRQAKIAANNAYQADGRGIPYPEAQP